MTTVTNTDVANNTSAFDTFAELSTKSEPELKNIWDKTEKKLLEKKIWLIAPEQIKSYKEIFLSAKKSFRGVFRFLDASEFKSPPFVEFILINDSVTIRDIKLAIQKFAHLSKKEIDVRISFMGLVPLKNELTFRGDLLCHGRGGEQFLISISRNPST